jgi:hypothetical protein
MVTCCIDGRPVAASVDPLVSPVALMCWTIAAEDDPVAAGGKMGAAFGNACVSHAPISTGTTISGATLVRLSRSRTIARDKRDLTAPVCGPDPERHRAANREFVDAGVDNVYVHLVGHDQAGFVEFYRCAILPKF